MTKTEKYNEWLAGLIDGDGYFGLSKKGYASVEITTETRDEACLYAIKRRFGGSVKPIAGLKACRYRLHHHSGVVELITAVNGKIRNPTRLTQMYKLCEKYKIEIRYAEPLTYENAWLSGFIDADGSIYINTLSGQVFITASQKNKLLLDPLVALYGGAVYAVKTTESFKWTVSRKEEVLALLKYFTENKLKSAKMNRVRIIPEIYECFKKGMLKESLNKTTEGKLCERLRDKWETYG